MQSLNVFKSDDAIDSAKIKVEVLKSGCKLLTYVPRPISLRQDSSELSKQLLNTHSAMQKKEPK